MSTFTKPGWTEEGPGPLASPSLGYSKAAGAIQAVAPDPVDRDRVFVATVGGGIWRSTNAVSAADPTWTPLTDQQPSLSMSAVAFSPLDGTRNTLFAGCGATSHSEPLVGSNSGPLFGLLKTTDGGQTWTELARNTFQGATISRILPTVQVTQQGQVLLVATSGAGLQRSADGGHTWTKVAALGDDHVSDVIADPSDPHRVYASTWNGVFRSDDGGDQNWTDVSAGLGKLPPYPVIKFSFARVAEQTGHHRLYAVVANWQSGSGLFFTADAGATWISLGLPPLTQQPPVQEKPMPGMAASPLDANAVFCASDRGNHWLVKAGADGSPAQWTQLDITMWASGAANGTSPHTDSRDCAFSADPNVMFETDDGGIYRLINAHGTQKSPARAWQPAVGNIRIAEFHAIAYDSTHHILLGATQDTSVPQQTSPDGIYWAINEDNWGDGFEVGVDNSDAQSLFPFPWWPIGTSVHYSSQQNLFHSRRRTYLTPVWVTQDEGMPFTVNGTGGLGWNKVEGALPQGGLGTVRRNQTWTVNAVDGKRILLGTDYLYESFDRGDTMESLGGLKRNQNGEWIPDNPVGRVSAYAYGHRTNPDVIYIGAGGKLLLRRGKQGLPTEVTTYPGSAPVGIALDPGDWRSAYILDAQGRVFRWFDPGARWHELTGNLPALTGDLRAIDVFAPSVPIADEVIFVAGHGGVFICTNPGTGKFAFWQKHGTAFPNAVVTGLHYSAADDVLVAGTLGRAAFSLKNVTHTILGGPRLTIHALQKSSCLGGWLAGSTITFNAAIEDEQDLKPPLTYDWETPGAATVSSVVPWQLKVTMPGAGYEVDVMLTVTDETGFKVFAALSQVTVSPRVMDLRISFCRLINILQTTAIFNWPINPLGPPIQSGDGHVTRELYVEAEERVKELGGVLAHLARKDGGDFVRTPPTFAPERHRGTWKRAYPSGEHARYIIPLRTDDDS
jgi:photosystem II stability/assembly factor-like uncharacterized protein